MRNTYDTEHRHGTTVPSASSRSGGRGSASRAAHHAGRLLRDFWRDQCYLNARLLQRPWED